MRTLLRKNDKNMSYLPRVAFWLVPRITEKLLLEEKIKALAKTYSSPVFLPHVTLYSCERSEDRQELGLLAAIAKQSSSFTMSVDSLGSSDRLAQTFFLNLRSCAEAERLSQSLATRLPKTSNYSFVPHLSLIYQDLPAAERNTLTSNWPAPIETICFDQLWAVAIPAQIEAVQDFYGWHPLLMCRLDSSPNAVTL